MEDYAVSVKRLFRSFFGVVLFVFFAITLFCMVVITRSFSFHSAIAELRSDALIQSPPSSPSASHVFNGTLLKFAAIDLEDAIFKRDISLLLNEDGGYTSQGSFRGFASPRRFYHRDNRARFSTRLPVMLQSSRLGSDFRKNLESWARRKAYEPGMLSDLIRSVKSQVDAHSGSTNSSKRYSSCAVVGNSGILLKTEYGSLIDSHEVVIRLNNARTETFERNVGSKTNISFINSNILHLCARRPSCLCHPYGDNVPIVMYICQAIHFLDYTVCKMSHKPPLIVTDPTFDVMCARIVKYYSLKRFVEETGRPLEEWVTVHDGPFFHYSSGFQAVMLALGFCDRVSIFGFGKSAAAKHHYHTNQKAELRLHDYEAEYTFYHNLVENPRAIPFLPKEFKIPPVVIYQ